MPWIFYAMGIGVFEYAGNVSSSVTTSSSKGILSTVSH